MFPGRSLHNTTGTRVPSRGNERKFQEKDIKAKVKEAGREQTKPRGRWAQREQQQDPKGPQESKLPLLQHTLTFPAALSTYQSLSISAEPWVSKKKKEQRSQDTKSPLTTEMASDKGRLVARGRAGWAKVEDEETGCSEGHSTELIKNRRDRSTLFAIFTKVHQSCVDNRWYKTHTLIWSTKNYMAWLRPPQQVIPPLPPALPRASRPRRSAPQVTHKVSQDLPKHPAILSHKWWCPSSPFHSIQMPPPQSSFPVTRSKVSSSHLSHSTPFVFLCSICDNYPFICLISTFH